MRMKEYIEREALLELYANEDDINIDNFHVPIQVIRQNILDQPTADVQETFYAMWVRKENHMFYWYECSHCGNKPLRNEWKEEVFSSEHLKVLSF